MTAPANPPEATPEAVTEQLVRSPIAEVEFLRLDRLSRIIENATGITDPDAFHDWMDRVRELAKRGIRLGSASLTEEQCSHIFICLGAGEKEFKKAKRSNEALQLHTSEIDSALSVNGELKRMFNPRAEEEARAESRRADPQLDLEDAMVETGGGHKAAATQLVSPTDETLRDTLAALDRLVLLSDIRSWSDQERDKAIHYANLLLAGGDENTTEEPEAISLVALTEQRAEELVRFGPVTNRDIHPELENTDVEVYLPAIGEEPEKSLGVFGDQQEAHVLTARHNIERLRQGDMDVTLVEPWLDAGPWEILCDPVPGDGQGVERWFVVHEADEQRWRVRSQSEARATAARYNRSVAGRDEQGAWRNPPQASHSSTALTSSP